MTQPRVLLLCGGRSAEHEVSLASARSILAATAGTLEMVPLVIDRGGRLLSAAASLMALEAGSAAAGSGELQLSEFSAAGADVVFPVLHGPNGEDGALQGLLRLAGLPFVGSSVLGSAVSMDKLMMKAVFAAHGLPQVAYFGLTRSVWQQRGAELPESGVTYPLFVKPANLGSSVGISRVSAPDELAAALELAFRFDRRVIVEAAVSAVRELEVAVLGNDEPEASPVGEVRFMSAFYDYDTKYGAGQAQLLIPADIPAQVTAECQRLALAAFRVVDAAGLARVDFFYDEASGELLLNEINTMPGFTRTSMYPRLWQAAGLDYARLVERLVQLALDRGSE